MLVLVVVVVGLTVVCAFELVVVGGCVRASAGIAVARLAIAPVAMIADRRLRMVTYGGG